MRYYCINFENAAYGNLGNRSVNNVEESISLSSFFVNFEEVKLAFADENNTENPCERDGDMELKGAFDFDLNAVLAMGDLSTTTDSDGNSGITNSPTDQSGEQ